MSDLNQATLAQKKCVACEGGVAKLEGAALEAMKAALPTWEVREGTLRRRFTFKDFRHAIFFVNEIAAIAEHEGHHPDFTVNGYKHVDFAITTHDIGGLSENDFILAAKIEAAARP